MTRRRRWAEPILLAALLLALSGAAMAAPTTAAAPKKQATQKDDWPRQVHLGETTVSLDAPRADSLDGTKLAAHGSARVQRAVETEPSFGTVWYEAEVEVNRSERTVTLVSVTVPRVQLAGVPAARLQQMSTRLGTAVTRLQLQLPLDDVLASIRLAGVREEAPPKLNNEPPKILFETEPAILIVYDGEPRFRPVEGSRLERALNTPFLVLHDPGENAYFLNGGTSWYHGPDPKGPWVRMDSVPAEAAKIASRDLKEAGVAETEVQEAKKSEDKRVPKILTATEPTELIVSDGPPRWSPVVAGELEMLASSESDVFRTLPDHQIFLVLSGRWYKSAGMGGPWAYVEPGRLPASFGRIPADSPRADVLAFVPGTALAREALADASTPRTAAIRRSEAHVSVSYDGDPKFEAVPGTHVEYAVNTAEQVLRIRGRYYACDQGVWFSAGSPTGPWAVADSIPEAEIQEIPPESPVYNTRYVSVYDSTPELVYTAYTPAYLGSYPYYGGVVYGTGWLYRPWWGAYYYPRPWTWGFHAMYRPWVGWGYGFGWGPAWGGFRYGFGFGWGARWCGPGGFYRPFNRNVNVTRNVTVNRNVTRNVYNSGANKTRATTTQTASKAKGTPKQGSGKQGQTAQGSKKTPSGHTNKATPEGAKAKSSTGQKGGHAGAKPGGKAPKGGGKKG